MIYDLPNCAGARQPSSILSPPSSLWLRALAVAALLSCAVFGAAASPAARVADTNSVLAAWLGAQQRIHTWSADFVQTRTLRTLVQPLTARGHVWFAAPDRFRWVLGNPAQTIAIRQTNDLYVIYPRLQRAERYPLTGQTGQWRDILALLDAGFPRSEAGLQARYNVLALTQGDDTAQVTLQPKSAAARRMMPEIQIVFSTTDYSLRATELHFADGSTLRNDFAKPVLNPRLNESLFTPKLGPGYKVVEPLSQNSFNR